MLQNKMDLLLATFVYWWVILFASLSLSCRRRACASERTKVGQTNRATDRQRVSESEKEENVRSVMKDACCYAKTIV